MHLLCQQIPNNGGVLKLRDPKKAWNVRISVFTQIIQLRLEQWDSTYNIIPQSQNGFRKNKGCVDSIFILNSLIQIHFGLRNKKLYCCFIDFQRAFDSITHDLLWKRLQTLGLSGKMFRIIQQLYRNMKVCIKNNNSKTRELFLSKGGHTRGNT